MADAQRAPSAPFYTQTYPQQRRPSQTAPAGHTVPATARPYDHRLHGAQGPGLAPIAIHETRYMSTPSPIFASGHPPPGVPYSATTIGHHQQQSLVVPQPATINHLQTMFQQISQQMRESSNLVMNEIKSRQEVLSKEIRDLRQEINLPRQDALREFGKIYKTHHKLLVERVASLEEVVTKSHEVVERVDYNLQEMVEREGDPNANVVIPQTAEMQVQTDEIQEELQASSNSSADISGVTIVNEDSFSLPKDKVASVLSQSTAASLKPASWGPDDPTHSTPVKDHAGFFHPDMSPQGTQPYSLYIAPVQTQATRLYIPPASFSPSPSGSRSPSIYHSPLETMNAIPSSVSPEQLSTRVMKSPTVCESPILQPQHRMSRDLSLSPPLLHDRLGRGRFGLPTPAPDGDGLPTSNSRSATPPSTADAGTPRHLSRLRTLSRSPLREGQDGMQETGPIHKPHLNLRLNRDHDLEDPLSSPLTSIASVSSSEDNSEVKSADTPASSLARAGRFKKTPSSAPSTPRRQPERQGRPPEGSMRNKLKLKRSPSPSTPTRPRKKIRIRAPEDIENARKVKREKNRNMKNTATAPVSPAKPEAAKHVVLLQDVKVEWPAFVESSKQHLSVECGKCKNWYHLGCAGLTHAPKNYRCRYCKYSYYIPAPSKEACCRPECDQPAFFFMKRVVARTALRTMEDGREDYHWLVEWEGYEYDECTFEESHTVLEADSEAITNFYAMLRKEGNTVDENEDTEQRFVLRDVQPALVVLDKIWRELIR